MLTAQTRQNEDLRIDEEFSALIPPLTDDERKQLEANLLAEGCRDPLVIWQKEGLLLDGHNRVRICREHHIAFDVRKISLPDRDAAKVWIIRNQFGRRNLTPYQRAELALKLEPLISAEAKENERRGGGSGPSGRQKSANPVNTRIKVAKAAGVSHDTIAKAKFLDQHADTETKRKLRTGETSINAAVKDIRRKQKRAGVTTKAAQVPSGKYRVIYADPPWEYGNAGLTEYGHAKSHYPTMPLDDLCAMPVQEWAEDDAVLFLWATSPMLENAFQVIRAWGFKYKTSFVWDKVKHNFGHYNSVRHEFLLVCTRGSCTPDAGKLFDSVQTIERSDRHSEKPEEFRKIIETLYTRGARLELFARAKHPGWSSFGNQLDAAAV
jgi:N6-adenosine-specific RNA methylase IME4